MTARTRTHAHLAAALGVSDRQFLRYRARGLPLPRRGEPIDRWIARAQDWRDQNRGQPGPRARREPADRDALERQRRLRAELLEIELAERRACLHSVETCRAEAATRERVIRDTFEGLADELAHLLYEAPSPDAIKVAVDDALRRRFARLQEPDPR